MLDEDMLDDDGYPTDAALSIIESWPYKDPKGWFKFIVSLWNYVDYGWSEEIVPHEYRKKMVHRYTISTAGWSGNESIIRAMEKNDILWHFTWLQSRRGGHYIFEYVIDEDE